MDNKLVSVQISGLDDLERKLYELPKKFAQRAVREAIKPAIQPWVDEIRRWASEGDYATGWLASQVATRITTKARDEAGTGSVGFTKKINPARHGKNVPTAALEAYWKELGTVSEPARPGMRPAFESKASVVLDIFTSGLKRILGEVFGA
jgi:HK97 gp10 family phage protein